MAKTKGRKLAKPVKGTKRPVAKQGKRAPARKVSVAEKRALIQKATELDPVAVFRVGLAALGIDVELSHRLVGIALHRQVELRDVLREAVQRYVESEFVDPTTPEKDAELYPATNAPVEELPLQRSTMSNGHGSVEETSDVEE